jgi:hypothetical protein
LKEGDGGVEKLFGGAQFHQNLHAYSLVHARVLAKRRQVQSKRVGEVHSAKKQEKKNKKKLALSSAMDFR